MATNTRTPRRLSARLLLLASVNLAVFMVPRVGRGQLQVSPSRAISFQHDQQDLCGTTRAEMVGAGSTSLSCTAVGAQFTGVTEALNGRVRALAGVTGSGNLFPSGYDRYQAYSFSEWADRLTITRGAPVGLEITMRWSGVTTAAASGVLQGVFLPNASASALAGWNLNVTDERKNQLIPGYFDTEQVNAALSLTRASDAASNPFSDVQTFQVPLVGAGGFLLPSIILQHSVTLYAGFLANAASSGGTPFVMSALADMSHTGVITGLVFRDAAGNDITGAVGYAFDNGTQVGLDVSPVPEPAALTLTGLGLAALGVSAWRRRAPKRRIA